MLVENTHPPGWRSIDPRNKRPVREPLPPFIADAPDRAAVVARQRAVRGIPLAGEPGLVERCELAQQALSLIETIGVKDRRKLEEAITKRDAIVIPDAYTFDGHKPRPPRPKGDAAIAQCRTELLQKHNQAKRDLHRATVECDTLAHELATRQVKQPGDLRTAVAYLLANPIPED